VSEQLDADVVWNNKDQSITVTDGGTTIRMTVGDKNATVNGETVLLPEAPELINQSTFVPIAFITRALGGEPSWDGTIGIVTITKEF